jgi:hypothetical protein
MQMFRVVLDGTSLINTEKQIKTELMAKLLPELVFARNISS